MTRKLKDLSRLSGVVLDANLAQLNHLTHAVAQAEGKVRSINLRQAARFSQNPSTFGTDFVQATGFDDGWQKWLHRERAATLATQVKLLADREELLVQVRFAFGRKQAVDALLHRSESERIRGKPTR